MLVVVAVKGFPKRQFKGRWSCSALYLVIENVSLQSSQQFPSTHKKFYFIAASRKSILSHFVDGVSACECVWRCFDWKVTALRMCILNHSQMVSFNLHYTTKLDIYTFLVNVTPLSSGLLRRAVWYNLSTFDRSLLPLSSGRLVSFYQSTRRYSKYEDSNLHLFSVIQHKYIIVIS